MKYAKRTDRNHSEITQGLRKIGFSVVDCAAMGQGFPDICVGAGGVNYFFEIKTEKGKQNSRQKDFEAVWKGQYNIIRSVEDAINIINGCK